MAEFADTIKGAELGPAMQQAKQAVTALRDDLASKGIHMYGWDDGSIVLFRDLGPSGWKQTTVEGGEA